MGSEVSSADGADAVSARLAALTALLRAQQIPVGLSQLLVSHRALVGIEAAQRDQVHDALRAVLCSAHEQFSIFDAAFDAIFDAPAGTDGDGVELLPANQMVLEVPGLIVRDGADADDEGEDGQELPVAWSDLERIRETDFAELDPAQLTQARRLLERLSRRGPERPSRRTRPARRRRGSEPLDLRATTRRALRYGGEPLERRWHRPATRPRRVVLVLDVSGSMRRYAEPLMLYLRALVIGRPRVEAFAFSTRLTRITLDLARRDPTEALDRVSDWAGGTRIGEAIAELNRHHGARVGRGAIVVILSDGWDRGEPEQLARELARLRRSCHRLIWLNPLKAREGYEPLTRGMQAALAHIDVFMAGNSVASLEELATLLTRGIEQADARGAGVLVP